MRFLPYIIAKSMVKAQKSTQSTVDALKISVVNGQAALTRSRSYDCGVYGRDLPLGHQDHTAYRDIRRCILTLQVNRVCVWCYSSEVSPGDPTSSPSLTEPVLLCEREIAADTTDLKFLDEERIVGSFSNGCVSLFRYSAAMQVDDVLVQYFAGKHPPSFLPCFLPSLSLLSFLLSVLNIFIELHHILLKY